MIVDVSEDILSRRVVKVVVVLLDTLVANMNESSSLISNSPATGKGDLTMLSLAPSPELIHISVRSSSATGDIVLIENLCSDIIGESCRAGLGGVLRVSEEGVVESKGPRIDLSDLSDAEKLGELDPTGISGASATMLKIGTSRSIGQSS